MIAQPMVKIIVAIVYLINLFISPYLFVVG
jgi:hypothetical protein